MAPQSLAVNPSSTDRYKFSWSPRGVLAAAQNSARYLREGLVVEVPGHQLLQVAEPVDFLKVCVLTYEDTHTHAHTHTHTHTLTHSHTHTHTGTHAHTHIHTPANPHIRVSIHQNPTPNTQAFALEAL